MHHEIKKISELIQRGKRLWPKGDTTKLPFLPLPRSSRCRGKNFLISWRGNTIRNYYCVKLVCQGRDIQLSQLSSTLSQVLQPRSWQKLFTTKQITLKKVDVPKKTKPSDLLQLAKLIKSMQRHVRGAFLQGQQIVEVDGRLFSTKTLLKKTYDAEGSNCFKPKQN